LAGLGFVELDVLLQLLLLFSQLRSRVLALGGLNLQRQHRQLQLEHLILDLAPLQSRARLRLVAAGGLDSLVEPALLRLCRLGRLARRLENGKVLLVDRGKV
jgi:hypothetical protein